MIEDDEAHRERTKGLYFGEESGESVTTGG